MLYDLWHGIAQIDDLPEFRYRLRPIGTV